MEDEQQSVVYKLKHLKVLIEGFLETIMLSTRLSPQDAFRIITRLDNAIGFLTELRDDLAFEIEQKKFDSKIKRMIDGEVYELIPNGGKDDAL